MAPYSVAPRASDWIRYVPTSLNADIVNERGKSYQAEMLKCVDKLNHRIWLNRVREIL